MTVKEYEVKVSAHPPCPLCELRDSRADIFEAFVLGVMLTHGVEDGIGFVESRLCPSHCARLNENSIRVLHRVMRFRRGGS